MQIVAAFDCFNHCGFVGELGRDAKLNLRVVRLDENAAGPGDETTAKFCNFRNTSLLELHQKANIWWKIVH